MNIPRFPSRKALWLAVILLVACVALRLVSLGMLALLDPTEGRYASIAQQMFLSGDWVTPMTYVDGKLVPFLGKPPLFFWLTALSYHLFGMSEFSSRIPSFVGGLISLAATGYFAYAFISFEAAVAATFFLASSLLFFFISGACLLDPVVMAMMSMTMLTAALLLKEEDRHKQRRWGWLCFCSLALAFLTKGPVAIAIFCAALLPWLAWTRRIVDLKKFPWYSGTLLFVALVAPWFVIAEQATPGFLRYFFINENFLRFLVHNYGDRYGSAHTHFYGYIWLMLVVGFLPWSFLFFLSKPRVVLATLKENQWVAYALLWGIAPALFFTFARQVSLAYVAPGLPGLAILSGILVTHSARSTKVIRQLSNYFGLATQLTAVCVVAGLLLSRDLRSALLALAIMAIVLLIKREKAVFSQVRLEVAANAFVTILLFTSLVAFFGDEINEHFSSRVIVERLEDHVVPQVAHAAFLGKVPQSAYFYARNEPNDILQWNAGSGNETRQVNERFVIASRKDTSAMSEALRKSLGSEARVGNYEMFDRGVDSH